MISDTVLAVIITGIFSVIVQMIISHNASKDLYAKLDKQSELSDAKLDTEIRVVKTQIDELTREVRKHNNFAERVPVLEEKINAANHRIDDLERKGGN